MAYLEDGLGRARRGHLGGARRPPPLRPLEGDGLGRVRPRGADGRGVRAATGRSTRWRELRDAGPPRGVRARASTPSAARSRSPTARAALDAATLMIPLVGFLPPDDERVIGTVEAIERELLRRRLRAALRHRSDADDGLPPGEGAFLPCSFWLADCLRDDRPPRRGARAVRPARRARATTSGCWPRSTTRASGRHGRQLPAGLHARRAGQHRDEPGRRDQPPRPSAARDARGGPALMRAITHRARAARLRRARGDARAGAEARARSSSTASRSASAGPTRRSSAATTARRRPAPSG